MNVINLTHKLEVIDVHMFFWEHESFFCHFCCVGTLVASSSKAKQQSDIESLPRDQDSYNPDLIWVLSSRFQDN